MIPDTFLRAHARLGARVVGETGGHEDPGDPDTVWAMPMVLHIPRDPRPSRTPLLEAAASAVVAVCLDQRAGGDGEWAGALESWCDARIRKVARRARGRQWEVLAELPGITVDRGGATARAFPPTPVDRVAHEIRRLQIGGTDLPAEDSGDAGAGDAGYSGADPVPFAGSGDDGGAPTIWVDGALGLTVGKAAAQVGHASMLLAGHMTVDRAYRWALDGFPCRVETADVATWRRVSAEAASGRGIVVADAGFTEVAPGSVTVAAIDAGA